MHIKLIMCIFILLKANSKSIYSTVISKLRMARGASDLGHIAWFWDYLGLIVWTMPGKAVNISIVKPFKMSVEFLVHCVPCVSLLSNLGWKGLMTYLTKSVFLHDYWTKSDGIFFIKMQIISYFFIILSILRLIHKFGSYWCWKSDCNLFLFIFFFGGGASCIILTFCHDKNSFNSHSVSTNKQTHTTNRIYGNLHYKAARWLSTYK